MSQVPVDVWLWFGGLLVQSCAFAAVGTWWVSRVISAIREEIASERKEIDVAIGTVENEMRDRVSTAERRAGEAVAALREHVHSIEKFMRDTYVRRDSFYTTTDDVKKQIREFVEQLDRRFNRLEQKVDKLKATDPD